MTTAQRVLLVICPPFWTKLPPLGIAYLAAFLRARGHHVEVLDLNVRLYHRAPQPLRDRWRAACGPVAPDDFLAAAERDMPGAFEDACAHLPGPYEVIGFSVFRSNRASTEHCTAILRARFPESVFVAGGPEVMVDEWTNGAALTPTFQRLFNYSVAGEGEYALASLVESRCLPCAEQMVPLDALPFPTYEEEALVWYERKRALPMATSRGCIRGCAFCAERRLVPQYRTRSARSIVDEIAFQYRRGIIWFTFHDSLINGDLTILRAWCEDVIKRGMVITWEAQAAIRTDMDTELICLMKRAGCFNLFVGLESGSDRVLERMHKGYVADDAARFFARCHAAGLHVEVSLITGFPGEDECDLEETMRFLRLHKQAIPKIAQVNPFRPLAGTPCADAPAGGPERVTRLVQFLEAEHFVLTPAFINNL